MSEVFHPFYTEVLDNISSLDQDVTLSAPISSIRSNGAFFIELYFVLNSDFIVEENVCFKSFKKSGQNTTALLMFSLASSLNRAAIRYVFPEPKLPHKYSPF